MRRKIPWGVHQIGHMYASNVRAQTKDGEWVLAVAEPYTAGRWRAAWWVLTGRAYALMWPKPGELEGALESKVVRHG